MQAAASSPWPLRGSSGFTRSAAWPRTWPSPPRRPASAPPHPTGSGGRPRCSTSRSASRSPPRPW
eukprot:4342377-Lingulodinium_polyedra.AAC.1